MEGIHHIEEANAFKGILSTRLISYIETLALKATNGHAKGLYYYLTHVMDRCIRDYYKNIAVKRQLPYFFAGEAKVMEYATKFFSEEGFKVRPRSIYWLFADFKKSVNEWNGEDLDSFEGSAEGAMVLLGLHGLAAHLKFFDVPDLPEGNDRYLPAFFSLPDNLLAFLFLSCAAIPRYISKNDVIVNNGGGVGGGAKKATRNVHNVIVGENPGDTYELATWIFGNISNTVVSISTDFEHTVILAGLLILPNNIYYRLILRPRKTTLSLLMAQKETRPPNY